MDKLRFSPVPDDPHDAAAYWFARERGGLMDAAEAEQFSFWRQVPAHDQAYREMLAVWRVAEAVPAAALRDIVSSPSAREKDIRRATRRRHMGWSFAAVAAMTVTGIAGHYAFRQEVIFQEQYITATGERRQVTLPDGSVVNLNTATTVVIRFYKDTRHVLLEAGEAVFSVAHDRDRPFLVEAGLGRVRVTGTLFSVRRMADKLSVGVESGSVEVSRGTWRNTEKVQLVAGNGVIVTSSTIASMPDTVDMASLSAWQQGKVVFDATPLLQVIAEINRYRERPIRGHGDFTNMRLAGVFSVDDTETFLDILPTLLPVSVLRKQDGTVMVMART